MKISKLFNKRTMIILIVLLISILISLLGKNYMYSIVKIPSVRPHLINIAKVAVPLKNRILQGSVGDQISLLHYTSNNSVETKDGYTAACRLCDLSEGNFNGNNFKRVDLYFANLTGANLSNTDLSHSNLRNTNLTDADLNNAVIIGTHLIGANLSGANLDGVDLRDKNLREVNLSGVDLSTKDLTGTNLAGANLSNQNLSSTILIGSNLSGANLDGVDLKNMDFTGANLTGLDLSNKDLSGTNFNKANLSNVNLSKADLTGAVFTRSNLSNVNLDGVDLRNKDLTGANLTGVDLSNKDLTGTIIADRNSFEIIVNNPSNSNWTASDELKDLLVTRYDLSEDVQYLATKQGFLFESRNNKLRLVLDLTKDAQFSFYDDSPEAGLVGIASKGELFYVTYTSQDTNGSTSLVVDEYSINFTKARNIIKIVGYEDYHFGGNLMFDSLGKLYLSTGDGKLSSDEDEDENEIDYAQNLNSLKGKILRLDVSEKKLKPEIIAYGIRNPWGGTIDSKDRMFILQCGWYSIEAVYLLDDLYTGIPANLGWPVFEGTMRMRDAPLMLDDVLAPIFQYNDRPGCVTAGAYLDDLEMFLFADLMGTIRLLQQQKNGEWSIIDQYEVEDGYIVAFGRDEKTKKIFLAPDHLELEIVHDLK